MPNPVLIVEDEADLGMLLADVLESEGFEVVLTTSARAVERAVTLEPSVVVTDYAMPSLSGAEVIQGIRNAMPATAPPVVLVTGMDKPEELAAQLQAQAYLRKPFDMDDFVNTVRLVSREAR